MAKRKKEVTAEQGRLQNLMKGLELSDDKVLATAGNTIDRVTKDGRVFPVSDLEKDLSSTEMYQALVDFGVVKREIRVKLEPSYSYHYRVNPIYKQHFEKYGTGIKLRTASRLLVDSLFLEKAIERFKNKTTNEKNETKAEIEQQRVTALRKAYEKVE